MGGTVERGVGARADDGGLDVDLAAGEGDIVGVPRNDSGSHVIVGPGQNNRTTSCW